jgi:hypothetical protein
VVLVEHNGPGKDRHQAAEEGNKFGDHVLADGLRRYSKRGENIAMVAEAGIGMVGVCALALRGEEEDTRAEDTVEQALSADLSQGPMFGTD